MLCQCTREDLERDLDTQKVVCLFASLAPDDRLIDFYRLSKGHRNQNFLLSTSKGKYLLRIRSRQAEHWPATSDVEQAVFHQLEQSIVHPVLLCKRRDLSMECDLYDYLEGRELDGAMDFLSVDAMHQLFFQLGHDLASIHATKSFASPGVLDENLNIVKVLPGILSWWDLFATETLKRRLDVLLWERIRKALDTHQSTCRLLDEDVCLVHGDCSRENILLRTSDLAFLDWEFVSAGHRYADIGQLFRGVSGEAKERTWFEQGYESRLPGVLDELWWRLAKLRDLFSLIQLMGRTETEEERVNDLTKWLVHTLGELER